MIGVLVTFTIILMGVTLALGFDVTYLVDSGSLFIIFGSNYLFVYFIKGVNKLNKGFKIVFKGYKIDEIEELSEIISLYRKMQKSFVFTGLAGCVYGLFMMAINISNIGSLAPYVGIAFISLLYGMLVSFLVLLPIRLMLERKHRKMYFKA